MARLLPRARLLAPALALGFGLGLAPTVAGAHPGPVDGSGGHFCQASEAATNMCTPAGSYHRHTPEGNMLLTTPPTGATPATTPPATVVPAAPTTVVAVPVTAAPAPATPPPAMARTGRASRELALAGLLVAAVGGMALFGTRLVRLPVILELERPRLHN